MTPPGGDRRPATERGPVDWGVGRGAAPSEPTPGQRARSPWPVAVRRQRLAGIAFALVGHSKQHDSLQKVDGRVEFKWSLLDTREMEGWNPKIHVDREYYMSKHDQGRYPFIFRMLYKLPYFFRRFNQRVIRLTIS